MIEKALAQAGLEREAIECIAVGIGPGSYTGIRAGIALVQGWQLAREIRVLAISSVEAIAEQAFSTGVRGKIHVVVDAQRNEFYHATYDLTETKFSAAEPLRLLPANSILERIQDGEIVIGPDAHHFKGETLYPTAESLVRLAASRSNYIDAAMLEPIYLREATFVKAPPPRVIQ